MIKYLIVFFIILLNFFFSITSCLSEKQMKDDLVCIDIRKNYPEKEFFLTDLADVTYIYLNSENENYLFQGGIRCVTENTIVVYDNSSESILFFYKNGKPKSRFNRKGQGPEEYIFARTIIYDEVADDVFVLSSGNPDIILVYSSIGEYKRNLILPKGTFVNPFLSFDEESLFVYNSRSDIKRTTQNKEDLPEDFFYIPFARISKEDGKILDSIELYNNSIILKDDRDFKDREFPPIGLTTRIIKCSEGILVCNPEADTVFLFSKEKCLKPIICKTPLVGTLDPMVYMNNCVDVGRYQFMEVFTVRWEEGAFPFPVKYFIRDKKTGEVFRQKIILPDYKGKEFIFSPLQSGRDYENGPWFELDLIELKHAYNENRLNGKLKELVATLDEDKDNNVFMFVKFK